MSRGGRPRPLDVDILRRVAATPRRGYFAESRESRRRGRDADARKRPGLDARRYKDAAAEPVLLVDKGNDGTKPGELAHYGYIKLEKKRKGWLRWAASSAVGRGGSSYEYLEDPITREVDLHDLGIFGLQYDN